MRNSKIVELGEVHKGMYFECLVNDNADYNISATLKTKALDIDILQLALNVIVEQQPALRMRLLEPDEQVCFEICDAITMDIETANITSRAQVDAQLKKWMQNKYDLQTGPLFKMAVIKNSDEAFLLYFGIHHLIGDGTSLVNLINQLFSVYQQIKQGESFDITIDNGYVDFLVEERQLLQAGKYNSQKDYWHDKLSGASILPDQRVITRRQTSDLAATAHSYSQAIDSAVYRRITEAAKVLQISPFMFCLGTFAIFLGKQYQVDDVTFSSAFNHRPGFDQDDSVGCFIYNLPMRFNTDSSRAVKQVLQDAQTEIYSAYGNIGYPTNRLIRETNLVGHSGKSVLDISFISDAYALESNLIDGFYKLPVTTFPGSLMVLLEDLNGDITMNFQYKTDIYDKATISQFCKRYVYLLEQISNDLNMTIADTQLITLDELAKLNAWSTTAVVNQEPTHIIEYFYKQVDIDPDAHRLIWQDGSMSNREIDQLSNQLAHTLIELGVSAETRVGIEMDRSQHLLIAILGILKAGGAYVPIDQSYPATRKAFIIEDADISIVIGDQVDAHTALTMINPQRIDLLSAKITRPQVAISPNQLCYVEYTSGSTGRPKGVMIEHAAVVNTALALEARFPLEQDDCYLLKTTFSFDIFGTEFYGWLVGQGRLFILDDGQEKDPGAMVTAIYQQAITHLNFVPSMFSHFIDYVVDNQLTLPSLKWLFVGGEAISPRLIKRYLELNWSATLENVYGPTEATMWATHYPIRSNITSGHTPIGLPLNSYRSYVLDRSMQLVPIGTIGELYIASPSLARGYLNLADKTARAFVDNPFYNSEVDPPQYERLYATGDLALWSDDGNLVFIGRDDNQIKLNGVRLELGEVESAVRTTLKNGNVAALLLQDPDEQTTLCVAYDGPQAHDTVQLKARLATLLPQYMIPQIVEYFHHLPALTNGKIDRKALMEHFNNWQTINPSSHDNQDDHASVTLARLWQSLLKKPSIDQTKTFFENGGNSLKLLSLQSQIKRQLGIQLKVTELLSAARFNDMVALINHTIPAESNKRETTANEPIKQVDVAIVGMGLDVPGAHDIDAFWQNLTAGIESICYFSEEELLASGITPEEVANPNYVRAHGALEHLDGFDEKFFKMTPVEVSLASPQLRVLYKTAWRAIEDAGLNIAKDNQIGVYVGGSDDMAWYQSSVFNRANYSDVYQAYTMATNHFLSTRLSYQFNLKGPSITSLSGCSTSLLTVHQACKAIQNGECEAALAGGVTVETPNIKGYTHVPGMMFSPDGHVRPFDEKAAGTVFANGCGIVVLKPLARAMADGDHIYAVIKGSAANNDGSEKQSFTAPDISGQVSVMQKAHRDANIVPQSIGYVEAHGTGTFLGDPIEVESLTSAFNTDQRQFCVLGSVKGNVGHTDTAAGVIGLIKTALCLDHCHIPATINYHTANPNIDFANTPFIVKNKGEAWPSDQDTPRRAAINSFGVGGTNVHMVLQEHHSKTPNEEEAPYQLLQFSAVTASATKQTAHKIANYLYQSKPRISDAAYTLTQRVPFQYRKTLVLPLDDQDQSLDNWQTLIEDSALIQAISYQQVAFMFSGQGTQYQGMARDLYNDTKHPFSRVFKAQLDDVFSCMTPTDRQLYRDILFGQAEAMRINQTIYSQLCIFAVQYALAKSLLALGIEPTVLVGHSIGELTAATIAGVWSLNDAVKIILKRSQLMQAQEKGAMIAISLNADQLTDYLVPDTWLSLQNTTDRSVIGGTLSAIDKLKQKLTAASIQYAELKTSHAFHTPMMQAAANQFENFLSTIHMQVPQVKILSNTVGGEVPANTYCKASYWAEHITHTVLFDQELSVLYQDNLIGIEIGPGRTISSFATLHSERCKDKHRFVQTIRHPRDKVDDVIFLLDQLGKLWCHGYPLEWTKLYDAGHHKRIHLPSYEFDKTAYPIKVNISRAGQVASADELVSPVQLVEVLDQDQVRQQIIASFIDVFGYESIDPNEDFFELGGDSLKAASLSGVIQSRLGVQLTVQDIFAAKTPDKLSRLVDVDNISSEPAIVAMPKADNYVLSSSQARMFAFYQMDKDGLAYNLPSATRIQGKLDKDRVISTFKQLVACHDSLRTQFTIKDGVVRQQVLERVDLPISFSAFTGEPFDYQRAFERFVKPFKLEQAPLFRVHIEEISDDESIFFFDIHHIIADASAVEVISGQFNQCYRGETLQRGIQYTDYANWEAQFNQTERYLKQKSYWLNSLAGDLPTLNLPTDYERPKYIQFDGERYSFEIPQSLRDKINQYVKSNQTSNFMVLLAMWSAFLARLTGDEDIIIGTPVAGRTRDEIRHTVGMFVNMLAMRSFPQMQKQAAVYLEEVKEIVLQGLSHQDYQFDQLVEALDVPRALNRNAIFDVSFDYHNIQLQELQVDNLVFTELDTPIKAAAVDILLTVNEHASGELSGFVDYSTKLFNASTIERIVKMYLTFSEALLDQLDSALIDIDYLLAEDRDFYHAQQSENALVYDTRQTIVDLWHETADHMADQVAIVSNTNGEILFSELDKAANGIAHKLLALGLKAGDAVGIFARRQPGLIAAMLAVLKAGGHYIALDPAYPKDRLQYMVDNSQLKLMITLQDEDFSFDYRDQIINIQSLTASEERTASQISVDDICYTCYTSGSTGYPKGVQVKHRGLYNMLVDHREKSIFEYGNGAIVCMASPSFDIFAVESIVPLALGNRVFLADENELLDAAIIAKAVVDQRLTHIQATVSRLRAMTESKAFQPALQQLKVIICGGEHYPINLLQALQNSTNAKLYNMYGPTETTITATLAELTDQRTITIGKPLYNVQTYIIDQAEKLQPLGVFGELCIGGHGVAKGYINNPEMTARVFKALPELPNQTIYRTGDLARILVDGSIELVGRVDNQVKLRGYRIELGEIEKACLQMPEIDNAVAKLVKVGTDSHDELALFYIVHEQHDQLNNIETLIKAKLNQHLPSYMLPDIYQRRQAFPLSPNNKVDRKALQLEQCQQAKKRLLTHHQLQPLEQAIVDIWQAVLAKQSIAVTDNFFDIGGNSFNLMLVNNQLNEKLGAEIALMTLFEFPTVQSLAQHLSQDDNQQLILDDYQCQPSVEDDIAVIGVAGRFPGADSVEQLWQNLVAGKEAVVAFSERELQESGIDPAVYQAPNYVNAKGYLADTEYFDYEFFNYTKKEASKMDPQIRLFHQCVYHALEDAGYDTTRYNGKIALFGGSSSNLPWMAHQLQQSDNDVEMFELMTLNDKDFLTTKVSYKLNLKGMSVNVQTACSTSLVAVHQAVQHLINGESDMAIAGGVSITYPQKEGYPWYEGMIFSRDGHCRPFDQAASGTISGNGCGVVVLKRLSAAQRDGDQIYAVIKGSAVNNDGINKIGYTAPSIAGQRDVIETALRRASLKPEAIHYVEAHGTGTALGDPIEIEGLKQAWKTNDKNYCALGSIKSNIGHLDAAAGIAGFIKTVMVLRHRQVPKMINFTGINPKIDIANSPFYINDETIQLNGQQINAAVSAFGMGGTNAHVILSEAPKV